MKIYTEASEFEGARSCVALGTFDGVHIGHQALINRAIDMARAGDAESVVCTFDCHPMHILCPKREPVPLMTLEQKLEKLEKMGVDGVLLTKFTREFAAMDPIVYLRALARDMRPVAVVAGFNYTFGAGGRGNAVLIEQMAAELSYSAQIVPAVTDAGENVSSTLIRRLLREGDNERAARLLRLRGDC